MREKYENLLNEIEEISRDSYALAEVLYGYCEYQDGGKVSSSMLSNFFEKIKNEQRKIITLIDKKSTEIGHEFYLKQNENVSTL